jgi:hypothetical protein
MCAFFAMIGIGSSIIASEINAYYNEDDLNKDNVIIMLTICNVSTIFLIGAIIVNIRMYLSWQITKENYHPKDTFITTGLWKGMLGEIALSLCMNYPSLYGNIYHEYGNSYSSYPPVPFRLNDLLLCAMLFCRFHFFLRAVLCMTMLTGPRAQRMCEMFGIEADYRFVIQAMMKN